MEVIHLVIIFLALLGVGILVSGLFRRLPLPYTVILLLIGVIIKSTAGYFDWDVDINNFRISTDLVLFIFLPILIFESGINLNTRQLFKNIVPVLTLAIPALFISALLIAGILHLLFGLTFTLALVFGALISATDPVAVVALFKTLGAPQRLLILLEGESLLNDATAIVLFGIVLTILTSNTTVGAETVLFSTLEFFKVFVGGIVIGVLAGLITNWVGRWLHWELAEVIVATVVCAYFSFVLSEHYLHISGVMGVVASSITIAALMLPKLTSDENFAVNVSWEFLSFVANTLLFLLMGLSINLERLVSSWPIILVAFAAVLLTRAFSIYGLLPTVIRFFKLPKIETPAKHILWWGGLRGGLAIAMVLSIPESVPGQELLLDLTLGVVFGTLVINAPTIEPLMKWLGLNKPTEYECIEIEHTQVHAKHKAKSLLRNFRDSHILSKAGYWELTQNLNTLFDHGHQHTELEAERISLQLSMLDREVQALKNIYEANIIGQYTYLELSDELQRKREHIIEQHFRPDFTQEERENIFERIEGWIIAHLRERNWASGILAWYQVVRQSEFLVRTSVHLQMSLAARKYIKYAEDLPQQAIDDCKSFVEKQIEYYRKLLVTTRQTYPEFYRRFMRNFSYKAALSAAFRGVERAYHHGSVGGKAFSHVAEDITFAAQHMPKLTQPVEDLNPIDLIRLVPLCSELPQTALSALAESAHSVKFLPNDVVIKQGQKGDALYIVVKGAIRVIRKESDNHEVKLAELSSGDFVGEMALLGDSVRQASIIATLPTTLLRITRHDILKISEAHPELKACLEAAKREREAENK